MAEAKYLLERAHGSGMGREGELFVRLFHAMKVVIDQRWSNNHLRSTVWRFYVNSRSGASLVLPELKMEYALTAGTGHLIPPWLLFSCCNSVPIGHFFVHFDVVGLPGPIIREVFDRPMTVPLSGAIGHLAQATEQAVQVASSATHLPTQVLAKALVHAVLAERLAQMPRPALDRCSQLVRGADPIQPALRHIDSHLAETMSNDELAARCHMSEDHFIRQFREAVGQTPAQYVIERRVAKAAQSLVFTNDTIETIAEATGFANRYYFSRVFKRLMGLGPAAYRKRAASDRV